MNNNSIVGWDIGGAHLKAVLIDQEGRLLKVIQHACPLWRGLDQLESAARSILAEMKGVAARHAITMTGELADIFPDRHTGVAQIARTMQHILADCEIALFAGPQGFVLPSRVGPVSEAIASANWYASALYLARHYSMAIFVDTGSTTTDMIVLHDGQPSARGYSDAERLRYEDLVYTGVVRTPVMAVVTHLPFAGEWQRVAAEHFATMADVYRLTGELPEGYDMAETADGQGKTLQDSARRLARMVGRDFEEAGLEEWRTLALAVRSQQLRTLQNALERQLSRFVFSADAPLIGAGAGTFLVRELARLMNRPFVEAHALITGDEIAKKWAGVCLPAYAVAWLLSQEPEWP